jgi:glycerate-2-kinase
LDEARWFSNEIRAPGRYVLAVAEPLSCFARSDRRGGRLAEFALASAIKIDGAVATWLLAMATDGLDGTTDAAGALVSGITCEKLRRAGIDPTCWLQEGKSFEALRTAEAIVPRFTSEVNHCDVLVGVS